MLKERWHIARLSWDNHAEVDQFLDDGWEPFSAVETDRNVLIYLRKLELREVPEWIDEASQM